MLAILLAAALALFAAFPAPVCASEWLTGALCSINGHTIPCAIDSSMSMGSRGVEVTLRDGRRFVVKNAVPRGSHATLADLTWDEETWLLDGRVARVDR